MLCLCDKAFLIIKWIKINKKSCKSDSSGYEFPFSYLITIILFLCRNTMTMVGWTIRIHLWEGLHGEAAQRGRLLVY